jgi:hypothetical protein
MGCVVCTCVQELRPRRGAGVGGSRAGIDGIARGSASGSTRGGDLHRAVTIEITGVSARGRCAASRGAVWGCGEPATRGINVEWKQGGGGGTRRCGGRFAVCERPTLGRPARC